MVNYCHIRVRSALLFGMTVFSVLCVFCCYRRKQLLAAADDKKKTTVGGAELKLTDRANESVGRAGLTYTPTHKTTVRQEV